MRNASRLLVFLILFGFWLIFSGHYDSLHLTLGILCSALVAFISHDLLVLNVASPNKLLKFWRFVRYVPWLLYEVVVANIHVVSLVIDPRKIKPQVVRFQTDLTSDLALIVLGNSITLTPGTITMDITDGEFVVHTVSEKAARDLLTGRMERGVAHVFMQPHGGKRSSREPDSS